MFSLLSFFNPFLAYLFFNSAFVFEKLTVGTLSPFTKLPDTSNSFSGGEISG